MYTLMRVYVYSSITVLESNVRKFEMLDEDRTMLFQWETIDSREASLVLLFSSYFFIHFLFSCSDIKMIIDTIAVTLNIR